MSRKGTPVPGSELGTNSSPLDLDKLKARIVEVEKILMARELTMKSLGDADDNTAGSPTQSRKMDRDWT